MISEDGEVWSIRRKKIISQYVDKDGYLRLGLHNNGQRKIYGIANLVALAFIGEPPPEMESPTIDHIDSNKKNNHYSNLRWLENSENSSSRKDKGEGEKNANAILSTDDVKEIYCLLDTGMSCQYIADRFHVTRSAISKIKAGQRWKHLYEERYGVAS